MHVLMLTRVRDTLAISVEMGNMLTAAMRSIFAFSPLMAEAIGLREAFFLAQSLSIPKAIFEADNQVLVETCRGNTQRGEILSIINYIATLKEEFESCGVTWTSKDGNNAANTIAKLASLGKLLGDWLRKPPRDLRLAIATDAQALLC